MKRVLSIGQCGFDHGSIATALRKQFGAEVVPVDDYLDALRWFQNQGTADLILVNRKLDADGGDGLAVIRAIKAEPTIPAVPVMLVSNFPQYQAEAAALGAAPGFGKAELHRPETLEKLKTYLGG